MSYDQKFGRYCDECGRVIEKAKRIHDDRDYCATCYARIFINVPCSRCQQPARVHSKDQDDPLCRKCKRLDWVCIRCSKPITIAGKISEGKPVCASCAPYFREKMHCAGCGRLSSRLSRMPKMGILDPLCDSCRTELTHKTCSICRKHRKVAGTDVAGRPYCVSCQPGKEKSHDCPGCGVSVPGNGASRCTGCLNLVAVEREGKMIAAMMTRDWVKPVVQEFAHWLHRRLPLKPNLVKLFRSHQSMFERLDAQFESRTDATAESILKFFGTAGLRRHLLVAEFLSENLNIKFTAKLKSDRAEHDRIEEKLRQCRKHAWEKVIFHYHDWLAKSNLPIRTVRLYLSTAVAFCEAVQVEDQAWEMPVISAFLQRQPGLRNNLSKFVGHCRRAYGWEVEMPPRASSASTDGGTKKIVLELRKLIHQVARKGMESIEIKVLEKIIAKSLGFRIGDIVRATDGQFIDETGKFFFQINEEVIPIPSELAEYFREYVRRRKAKHSSRKSSVDSCIAKSNSYRVNR